MRQSLAFVGPAITAACARIGPAASDHRPSAASGCLMIGVDVAVSAMTLFDPVSIMRARMPGARDAVTSARTASRLVSKWRIARLLPPTTIGVAFPITHRSLSGETYG